MVILFSSFTGVWYVIWVFERDIYLYSMYVPNKMEYLCNLCSHISTYDNLLWNEICYFTLSK